MPQSRARRAAHAERLQRELELGSLPPELRELAGRVIECADADAELARCVARARQRGRTWATIAAILSVSKQAARERFGS